MPFWEYAQVLKRVYTLLSVLSFYSNYRIYGFLFCFFLSSKCINIFLKPAYTRQIREENTNKKVHEL